MHALDSAQQAALVELLDNARADHHTTTSRRGFLKAGSAAGLVVGFGWFPAGRAFAAAPLDSTAAPITDPLMPNAFIRIGSDNLVTIVCKHHEMGQGNTTGLATLAADELDADWSLVRTEYAPADAKLYNNLAFGPLQGTGGSTAIANSFEQMRSAGATARAMLVAATADAWQVPPTEIKTSNNVLTHASGKRATYGEMAVAAASCRCRRTSSSSSRRSSRSSARRRRRRESIRRRSATAPRCTRST